MPQHPYIAATMERLAKLPAIAWSTPLAVRASFSTGTALLGPKAQMSSTLDVKIPTRDGQITARLLIPYPKPVGLVIYVHGGGWVIGGVEDFDTLGRRLAEVSGCAVLIPAYRLAPEHPFPAALYDVMDTVLAISNGALPQIPGKSLVLSGDSAGANLATVTARKLSEDHQIVAQVLFYPLTNCEFETDSYLRHGTGLPLTKAQMLWFFGHYAPRELWPNPDITPLNANDLHKLPRSVIVTAEYDVLAYEGRHYAEKLIREGVETTYVEAKGLAHGFLRQHNLLKPADDILMHVGDTIQQIYASQSGFATK